MKKILIGFAKDIHKLNKNKQKSLILGGLDLSHYSKYRIKAHSNGDIILHAITSAILSLTCNKTLGEIFEDTDPKNKDKDSVVFLKHALYLLKNKKMEIINIDLTIVCEKIMLRDHLVNINKNISKITGCKNISSKATRFENKRNKYIEVYANILLN